VGQRSAFKRLPAAANRWLEQLLTVETHAKPSNVNGLSAHTRHPRLSSPAAIVMRAGSHYLKAMLGDLHNVVLCGYQPKAPGPAIQLTRAQGG